MFKKAFQIVATFGLLVGAYRAYILGFAALTSRLGERPGAVVLFVHDESKSSKDANRLSVDSFGPDHWSADPKLKIRFYDAARGFYIYAGNYKRLDNGKRFEFYPFAIIWNGKDGRSRKTATSARALVELNEPMNLGKPGATAMHVVEATLEQDVELRDDKGTRSDRSDDLVVGALPSITYTEKTDPPQIFSRSDIKIVDRDLILTGFDLLIELRKHEGGSGPAGFDAKTAILKKNVHLVAKNAGRGGVLPGLAKGTPTGGPTPLDLRSDAEMRIDFPPKPKPLRPRVAGPPEPEGPTVATFHRNVAVVRGVTLPDVLNCDTLRLIMMSVPREPEPFDPSVLGGVVGLAILGPGANGLAPALGVGVSGPLTELALHEANARGFAVWLRSEAQGTTARCNELIYRKLAPEAPDESYLRADPGKQIKVDKIETAGPLPGEGPVTSVTTIWAADAKVFDDGKGGTASTVVARGPGRYESRPAQDKPAEQTATWNDSMVLRTIVDPITPGTVVAKKGTPAPSRRQISLTGSPRLEDLTKKMTLEARTSATFSLVSAPPSEAKDEAKGKDKPKAKADGAGAGAGRLASGGSRIEWVMARDDVKLTAPGKTMIARDALDAPFEQVVAALSAAPAKPSTTAPAPPRPVPGPGLVAGPSALGAKAKDQAKADDKPVTPAKADPAETIRANRIWVKIRQLAGGASEVAEARLRGAVKFHQDPAPDKPRGMDVAGEALDLDSVGAGLFRFKLMDTDPSAVRTGQARLAANGDGKGLLPRLATIDTDDYLIRGPIIGLDQSNDFAWVDGGGEFEQLADKGFLTDKGIDPATRGEGKPKAAGKAPAKLPAKKERMRITWTEQMRFYGRATDPEGRPAGKAEFRGSVTATTDDSKIQADLLDTYTDRPVVLAGPRKPKRPATGTGPTADTSLIDRMFTVSSVNPEDTPAGRGDDGAEEDKPRPELALVDARARPGRPYSDADPGVVVVSVRRDPAAPTEWIEKQRIAGQRVIYSKRTGDYSVPGPGLVHLWRRGADKPERPALPGGPLPTAGRPQVRPVSNGPKANDPAKPTVPAKAYGSWELTMIKFADRMVGRFGAGKDRDVVDDRTADFYGAVRAANALVLGPGSGLNFDRLPKDGKYMTANALRIVSVPPEPGVKDAPARHLMTAEGNGLARTSTHALQADLLKYDSLKDLFHAYGLEGRQVVITDQAHPGSPGSRIEGAAAEYNHKSEAMKLVEPNTISFIDAGSGIRPSAEKVKAALPEKTKPKRAPLRPPGASHIERKGFSGR